MFCYYGTLEGRGQNVFFFSFDLDLKFGLWGFRNFLRNWKSLPWRRDINGRSRDVFHEISRNVWEIPGFGGSENLLLNNRTHLHFVHISQFLAKSWHFGIQTELVFWIFDIFWFWAIFGVILSPKMQIFWFFAKFWSKWPQKWTKIKKYQKSKTQVLFVFQNASFLPKLGNMDKMEMSSIV